MLTSCSVLPREGYLQQLFQIFAYLDNKHNVERIFDQSIPNIDQSQFEKQDWSDSVYYASDIDGKLKEKIPTDMPRSRLDGLTMRASINSDHAGNQLTSRPRTDSIVFLNSN